MYFYCDETGFPLQTKSGKVLTAKVDKACYHLTSSSKTQITVMMCICADGSVLPPYVLFPGKCVRGALVIDLPPKSESYATESGWMNQNAFFHWLKNVFVASLPPATERGCVILLLDGHSSHQSYDTSVFCKKTRLFCLVYRPTLPIYCNH